LLFTLFLTTVSFCLKITEDRLKARLQLKEELNQQTAGGPAAGSVKEVETPRKLLGLEDEGKRQQH
jgi:hypothetical protein